MSSVVLWWHIRRGDIQDQRDSTFYHVEQIESMIMTLSSGEKLFLLPLLTGTYITKTFGNGRFQRDGKEHIFDYKVLEIHGVVFVAVELNVLSNKKNRYILRGCRSNEPSKNE